MKMGQHRFIFIYSRIWYKLQYRFEKTEKNSENAHVYCAIRWRS